MIRTEAEHLAHYGIQRRSGRYPWGSGDPESTRHRSFLDSVEMLKKSGMSEAEIAKVNSMSVADLRAQRSISLAYERQQKILTAERHRDDGWGYSEIGRRMGLNESTVRSLLAPGAKDKADVIQTTANMLKDQVNDKKIVDVGKGLEAQLGVTRSRLDTALSVLKNEGYSVYNIYTQQISGVGKYTTGKVLAIPGISKEYVNSHRDEIQIITDYSIDHGRSFLGIQPPINVSSRRIGIIYKEDGGDKADGVIYIRPGVKDVSIGNDRYAQVRIAVDGTHYLKGMAIYKDDLPPGRDLVFNTNKSKADAPRKKDAMKELESDDQLPFGSIVRQLHDEKGKVYSAMNIVGMKEGSGVEGSWDKWSRTLSTQMLSKQQPELVQQQLTQTYDRRKTEFAEINSLTNPTVRKDLLLKFADQTDAASVHLKAANLPRQATKVILPISSMKETEVYAPSMKNGERVALVRFPHGGTFEIPQLRVNNRNPEARKLLGNAQDAIGINHKVAHHLSGADFDGDTVLVIPNNKKTVQSTPPLEGLKDFDPMKYRIPKDSPIPVISSSRMQKEMGKVSNLIADMTIKGAGPDDLAKAIRHSMVVIDSEKGLDWQTSEKDNGILGLKEKYQGGKRKGAQTLISRAKAELYVPERVERPARQGGPFDPITGKRVYVPTGKKIPDYRFKYDPVTGRRIKVETGKMKTKMIRSTRLAEADDAFSVIPPDRIPTKTERIYAEHSNRLKAMANEARKIAIPIKGAPQSSTAKAVYKEEVSSLTAKLNNAKRNAPRERQAQRVAQVWVSQRQQANPNMEPEEVKKIKNSALNEARIRTGAKKDKIIITQKEWNAIQAGAISKSMLNEIIKNSDIDTVRHLALPKHTPKMTPSKTRRAQSMLNSGYTQAEVAEALGVSLSTLKITLSEGG